MRSPDSLATGANDPASAEAAPGPRIYNLFPSLVGTVQAWRAELPRIADLGFDWVYLNPFHEVGFSGSLYAVKDYDRLDPRFRDEGAGSDGAQLRAFVAEARSHGLRVMADLVINHTSKDALLTGLHPEAYLRDAQGELVSPHAVDPVDPTIRTEWGDLAELDWARAEARGVLLPFFERYLAILQELGFKGFRCDAAYKVPAEAWQELIGSAKRRDPECLFAAETLGCTFAETRAVAGAGFDLLFNSFAWWDLKAPWALEQYEELRLLAPSIAFPENHDMARVAAEIGEADPALVAAQLKLRYALAAFFSTGVLMPIGYEWGFRRPLHVVETTPADREATGVDISEWIRSVNALKADLPALNLEGAQRRLGPPDSPVLALLRLDAGHPVAARSGTLVLAHLGTEPATLDAGTLVAQAGGVLGRFAEFTPDRAPEPLSPGGTLRLEPGEIRIFAASLAAPALRLDAAPAEPQLAGRVVIENLAPEIDNGRAAAKRVVGEVFEVSADIFSDGHDKFFAELLFRAADEAEWRRAPMRFVDNDRWSGGFPLERNARYLYAIEGWRDPFATWLNEVEKKRAAGVEVRLETIEGVAILEKAATLARGEAAGKLASLVEEARRQPEGSGAQLALLLADENAALIAAHAERRDVSRTPVREVVADRLAARFSAWYELFPRSQSPVPGRHGTFRDVLRRLPYVRSLGFDVLYFTPIHPIGRTNRKGKNNALKAEPGDVGSVYAIGAEEGGHRAVHPDLGTLDDFRRLVAEAERHGLEIALDFAIQCSPDHPWIKEHPEWFEWRPDGSIRFAENPPKKYEDIVNVRFDEGGLPSLWLELRDTILFWVGQGVRIFRVDNPHTKPIPFWEWMIREVNDRHPDVLFLAEAFTKPKMMRKLAKIGFQQSYTYFTWRDTKHDLADYMNELAHSEMGEYYRPNFFVNTPDINPIYLQSSGRPGFIVRATLAATLSSVWGMYNGFELCMHTRGPKPEDYLDSEKYELKVWDYEEPGNIGAHIAKLNRARLENPALQDFRNIRFLNAWNDQILAYAKVTPAKDNAVMALVNLDPHNRQEGTYEVPLWEFGLPDHASIEVEDLISGERFTLHGKTHRIALEPETRPVALWRLIPPASA